MDEIEIVDHMRFMLTNSKGGANASRFVKLVKRRIEDGF